MTTTATVSKGLQGFVHNDRLTKRGSKRLTHAQRSASANQAWETRRANEKKAKRAANKAAKAKANGKTGTKGRKTVH